MGKVKLDVIIVPQYYYKQQDNLWGCTTREQLLSTQFISFLCILSLLPSIYDSEN